MIYTKTKYKEELIWLAGLLEGEGCFGIGKDRNGIIRKPSITLSMTDKDVVTKVANMFDKNVYIIKYHKQRFGRKLQYRVKLNDTLAINVMKLLLPYMGKRRSRKIKQIIVQWDKFYHKKRDQSVWILGDVI